MLTLVGTFIDARWRQNPQSRPPPSRSEVSLRSSDCVRKIWNSVNSTLAGAWKGDDGESALALLKVNSEGPGGMMPLFTETQILSNQ